MKRVKIPFFILVAYVFFTLPLSLNAQFQSLNQIASRSLVVNMSPEYPRAFEQVKISIQSSSLSLETALITWKIDGRTVLRGTGEQEITFTVGDYGKITFAQVIIETESDVVVRDIPVNPSYVDLVWEADTYTPPFYKGKALQTSEGAVRVVALPHFIRNGRLLTDKELFFQWFHKDGIVLSGVGKSVYQYHNYFTYKDDTIKIQISLPGGLVQTKNEIIIPTRDPKILLYEEDPLFGTQYQKAILEKDFLNKKETTYKVAPFFFSIQSPDDANLNYEWSLNNERLNDGTREKITFRTEDETKKGVSLVHLNLTDTLKQIQFVQKTFSFTFGKN